MIIMLLTGAEIIIETLIEQGCDTVFGYPGGFVLNIYDELYKNSDRINHIITAHEQGAAHAADGYARASGKVGVVIATSGPGVTNLVTGIATAFLDSTPIVAITGNVPLSMLGRDSFQEVDSTGITMPITKHNYIVKDVKDLANIIREAFVVAKSGRPGPVLVDVPKDIQLAKCEFEPSEMLEAEPKRTVSDNFLSKCADMINASKRPYIYCGGGAIAADASEEIKALSLKLNAPIGLSIMGLSAIPQDFPNWLGMMGMHGRYSSTKANYEADLIIALGVRFSDRATGDKSKFKRDSRIIHIDIDPAELNKNIDSCISAAGDIKNTVARLLNLVEEKDRTEWIDRIKEIKAEEQQQIAARENGRLTPQKVIAELQKHTDKDTIVVTDVGQHQMWTAQSYKFYKPRTLLTSGGLGTMGFGMGAAIGGCIARGRKRTVLFTGDGSFGMNLTELATAVSQNLPLTIVIMNNGVLGMVRQWQTLFFGKRYSNTTLERKTDFVRLAEAFGATGIRVSESGDLEAAMKKAFDTDGTVVIDCKIDMDENVYPMIPAGGTIEDIIVN